MHKTTVAPEQAYRQNQGYTIIYHLMEEDRQVSKIFWLKSASDPVKSVVSDIADFASRTADQLEKFKAADAQLNYNLPDMPKVEKDARDFSARRERGPLLSTSGKTFEVRLILSQAGAMNYASDIAAATAAMETDPERKAFLIDVSQRAANFYDQLNALLTVK